MDRQQERVASGVPEGPHQGALSHYDVSVPMVMRNAGEVEPTI